MAKSTPFQARSGLTWLPEIDDGLAEREADNLRTIATDIELALAKDRRGVNLNPQLATIIKQALFDFADLLERS